MVIEYVLFVLMPTGTTSDGLSYHSQPIRGQYPGHVTVSDGSSGQGIHNKGGPGDGNAKNAIISIITQHTHAKWIQADRYMNTQHC